MMKQYVHCHTLVTKHVQIPQTIYYYCTIYKCLYIEAAMTTSANSSVPEINIYICKYVQHMAMHSHITVLCEVIQPVCNHIILHTVSQQS